MGHSICCIALYFTTFAITDNVNDHNDHNDNDNNNNDVDDANANDNNDDIYDLNLIWSIFWFQATEC